MEINRCKKASDKQQGHGYYITEDTNRILFMSNIMIKMWVTSLE